MSNDLQEKHEMVSLEVLDQIRERSWLLLQSGPFKRTTMERLQHISFHYGDGMSHVGMALDEAVSIFNEVREALIISKNLDKAVYALVKIQLGKLLLMVKEHIRHYNKNMRDKSNKRETFDEVADRLFSSIAGRAARFNLMAVAKIPNVEAYAFLGITRLVALSNILKEMGEFDPIHELLEDSGYVFNLETEDDNNEFAFMVSKAANKRMLAEKNVPIDEANLTVVTNRAKNNILTRKAVQQMSAVYKRTNSVDTAVTSSIKSTKPKTTSPDLSPSYNKLEETVLQLTDMLEDILDDGYSPKDFDGEITASMFATLASLQEEVFYAWSESPSMKWKGFKEGFGR